MVETSGCVKGQKKSLGSVLTHYGLTIARSRKVRVGLYGSGAASTTAVSHAVLPAIVMVGISGISGLATWKVLARGSRLWVAIGVLGGSVREPLIVPCVGRSSRHAIVRRTVTRIGGSEWGTPWIVLPDAIATMVMLLSFE